MMRRRTRRSVFDTLDYKLMRRFQSPTVFLKVSCNGDYLLPIGIGEFAMENLINGHRGDDNGDCPDQFQFVENLIEKLDHQVNMIVLIDALRISYGLGRMREMRTAYDVSLDSAAEGPNLLAQELVLVKNIDLAIKEERYRDAATWRQELLKLGKLSQGNQC